MSKTTIFEDLPAKPKKRRKANAADELIYHGPGERRPCNKNDLVVVELVAFKRVVCKAGDLDWTGKKGKKWKVTGWRLSAQNPPKRSRISK